MNESAQLFLLDAQGFLTIEHFLSSDEIGAVSAQLAQCRCADAGDRAMLSHEWCRALAQCIRERLAAIHLLPPDSVAALCTYFNKTDGTNWGVPPHRDLAIPVRSQFDAPGWNNWSVKQGILHVQPSWCVLEDMLAVRLAVDAADADNGALCVAPGSHKTSEHAVPFELCPGGAGSVLLMRPLLIHASGKAISGRPRRVLHFLFGPKAPPAPANWHDPA